MPTKRIGGLWEKKEDTRRHRAKKKDWFREQKRLPRSGGEVVWTENCVQYLTASGYRGPGKRGKREIPDT